MGKADNAKYENKSKRNARSRGIKGLLGFLANAMIDPESGEITGGRCGSNYKDNTDSQYPGDGISDYRGNSSGLG